MMEKRQKGPLFYLQQPNLQLPKAKMQESYSSKRAEIEKQSVTLAEENKFDKTTKEAEKKKGAEKRENNLKANDAQQGEKNNQSSFEFQIKSKNKPSFQRVKSFKEMNILERLDYLIDFPKQLPPVPCIFEIEGNTLQGYLIGKTNEQIEIKQFDGKIETVHIQAIREVRMAGLRR